VQRLVTARWKLTKQRWSSVQNFCVGLADPSVHDLAPGGAKPRLGVVRAVVNFTGAEKLLFSSLAIFCAAQNFRSGRWDHRRWPSVYGVSLTVASVCWTVTSGDEYDSPLQERFSKVRAVGPRLMPKVFKLDSYSVHTTSLQRPYSVHTSFPQCPYICEHSDLLGLFEEIRLSV